MSRSSPQAAPDGVPSTLTFDVAFHDLQILEATVRAAVLEARTNASCQFDRGLSLMRDVHERARRADRSVAIADGNTGGATLLFQFNQSNAPMAVFLDPLALRGLVLDIQEELAARCH